MLLLFASASWCGDEVGLTIGRVVCSAAAQDTDEGGAVREVQDGEAARQARNTQHQRGRNAQAAGRCVVRSFVLFVHLTKVLLLGRFGIVMILVVPLPCIGCTVPVNASVSTDNLIFGRAARYGGGPF